MGGSPFFNRDPVVCGVNESTICAKSRFPIRIIIFDELELIRA